MKKILALVLALAMVITMVAVYADDGDLEKDAILSVAGLDANDVVYFYQVLEWKDGTGWVLTDAFDGDSTADPAVAGLNVANITSIINNTPGVSLSKADLEAITNYIKANSIAVTTSATADADGLATTDDPTAVGMYLALVEPAVAGTIYNPLVVSADFTTDNGTNEIDVSNAKMGAASTVAKKDSTTVTKVASDVTLDAGEEVTFTITTTIPVFAASYTNPMFNVTDTMQSGLAYSSGFTVSAGDVTYPADNAPNVGDTTFTIVFDTDKIAALTSPQTVTITYKAKITDTSALTNIVEKDNEVVVEFTHDPHDESKHGHLYDETKVYTFSLDASIFGDSDYRTGELVKVGVDANGNALLSEKTLSNQSKHSALVGAKFKLYTDAGCTSEYSNPAFNASLTNGYIVSDENGLLYIPGLDEGDYWIREEDAPDGWIKDSVAKKINITATKKTETYTKTFSDGCEVEYDVEIVTGYKVTIGGADSTYEWTNDGPSISEITPADSSSEIRNIKGVELPSTGGIGTTLFYLFGGIMVLAAGVVLVARRKAED